MVSSLMKTLDQSDEMLDLDGLMASLSTIPMTANSFRLFSAKLRTLLIEDTTSFKRSRCSVWDDFFAILFVYSFRFSSPSACWPRICRTLILQDSLDPMSVKGIVRNLIDRYFGIFTSVYANDVWNIEPFLLPWIDPATNLQNTLGFDTSFLHAVSIVPVGWGLLHHAAHASSQNMIAKLIDYGAEIGALDGDKRRPLHIAAASLNLDVSDYLSDNSRSSFIYDVDIYGKTPLDLLLQAASLSVWVDRVAPLRLFSTIIKLLGISRNLWCYNGDPLIDSSNDEKSDKVDFTAGIYSNKFYSILYHIRGCDDMVAVMIIELAKSCSSYLWNVPVIMQSIVLAVRQRRYRLLKNLLESFHEKLFTYFQYSSAYVSMGLNDMQVEGYFLQYCLAVAVQNKSSCRIISLLSHYITLQFSGRDDLQSHDSMPLTDVLNIAVMRCASLERTVLTAQESKAIFSPSNLEKIKKFAISLEDEENDLRSNGEEIDVLESIIEINGFTSVLHPCCMTESLRGPLGEEITALSRSAPLWSLFSDVENMSNKLSDISPLSLACLLGSSTILRTLLKNVPYSINLSTGPVPDLTDDISSPVSSPGGLGCNPVMCAVLSASPECLAVLKDHMGDKLFSEACLQTDECGNTPLHALLHFVKERALHSQRFHDRGLGPSSPSFPLDAFLTYDFKLEKIMQTFDVLLSTQRGVAVQCVSEGRRADREREAVLWGSRSIAIKERLVLINQRLTELHDDIIQAPEPPATPKRAITSDVTPLVCHSCPSFPTIRIHDEYSVPFLNKSMNNIIDFNEPENQLMKMLTKTEMEGSNNSESLPSNATKQRPTLSTLLESSEYVHAKKLALESKEQWGKLQLQLGTSKGVKKFFLRMRSFLRAVVPDKFTSLLVRCLVSLFENGNTVPHTGLSLSGVNRTRAQGEFNSSSSSSSSGSGPNTQPYLTPPRRGVSKFTIHDQIFKSKDPSKTVPGPTCAADLSLSWKALAVISGIRLRPGSFSRFDKTFQLFCKSLLALSSPLKSRVSNCADKIVNSDDVLQVIGDKKSSEGGGFTLSRGKWMEVRNMYVELKKIEKINSQKGLSTTSKFQWTVDLLFGYVQRVVRDGEALYGIDNCRQKGSERRTSLMYIEMADLMYCKKNLNEILPQIRDIEERLRVQTRTVNCDAMSSLLSHDPFPPPLKQLLPSYTDVIVEATASGAMSLSCSAASAAGCASHHFGGQRLTADADALAVLDACVLKLALPSSPHSSSSIGYRPTDYCEDATFTQDSSAMLSTTLFTLACANQWEAATLTLKRLASSILIDSSFMIQHPHSNPFACCYVEVGNSLQEALRFCAASVTPFTSSSNSPSSSSGLIQPSLEGVGSNRMNDVLANYADCAAHNKLYGLCSLHYAAAEGQFQFIQTALDLFGTATLPIRLITDIMLLTQLNMGNKADKELPTTLLTSMVSRADLDPMSVSLEDFLNIFVGENESPLHRAALDSIYSAASITANQKNSMNEDDLTVDGSMGVLCVPQYVGPLKGLCISTAPPHTSFTSHQHVFNNDCEGYTNTIIPHESECISQEESAATYVCMMDGSSMTYQDFISDIYNLNRALPVPQVALGVGHTGHTLLHETARSDDPGLFNSIIKDLTCTHTATAAAAPHPRSNSADTHSSTGRDISKVKSINSSGTAFTMNQDGATPVYLALLQGHVASVNDILTRCIERTTPTDHNTTSLRTDSAKYSTEVLSHGVDKKQTLEKRYQNGLRMERISYNDTLLSPIAISGSRAVQQSNANTNTNIQSLFLNAACTRVERAEKELTKTSVDHTASQPMAASVDTLKMVLDRAVDIQREISHTEFTVFTQLSYTPAGYVLDSLVRAKKILKLLSIPYSEIGSQNSTSSPENLNPKNTKNCIDSRNLNAAGVRGLLSQSVATEIKMLLAEWYAFRLESPGFDSFHSARRRCTDSASLAETLMLFHRLDLSAVSLGVLGGKAIGSKVRDNVKKVNPSVSGSPKEVPWWSGFSPARPRSDVHGNKHVKWEAQKVKNLTPQNLEKMNDPPSESPHALPAYVSLEIRTRSQWNQSNTSSFFSFMSPYHSDIFALPPQQQSRDSYKSSIPSNLYAVEMEESARCKEMEDFMELWILDPKSVKEVLRLSYLVLEFARLLVVARGLVVMTSDTQQECVRTVEGTGVGSVMTEHPLVRWQNEVNAANIYKKEVLDFMSNSALPSSPPIQPSNPYMNAAVSAGATIPSWDSGWNPLGMKSKFLQLNRVSSLELHGFLYPRNNVINQPAADRRDRIMQCILLLLLSTKKEKVVESASRIVRGFLPASSHYSDGGNGNPKGRQNRSAALLPTQPVRTQVAGNKNSTTSTRREIERQQNDCGIVLDGLKELCVSDICHSNNGDTMFNPYSAEGYGQRNGVSTADRAYRKEREQEKDKYLVHFEKSCEILYGCYVSIVPEEDSGDCAGRSLINGTDKNVVQCKGEKDYRNDPQGIHSVASALMDYLKCVRGVYRQRALYRRDVNSWMGDVKHNCNPLCALLSLPSASVVSKQARGIGAGTGHYTLEKAHRDEKKRESQGRIDCCRLLLSMGVSAFIPDKTGRIPLVTVALGGGDDRPSLLLEMLSYFSPDHHHHHHDHLSNNSNSNSNGSCATVASVHDQNTNTSTAPVAVQRRRILEGDDFKYLVWHVLMGCPARDTSPSPIPCDVQNKDRDSILHCDYNGDKYKYMIGSKQTKSKISAATRRRLNAEYASRNRVQVAILSILLDCGFPVCQPLGIYFSCLDLAALKMIPWGMLQIIEKMEFKIQDPPKKEITRIPLASIKSKPPTSTTSFNFNSSFSQSPPQYSVSSPFIIQSPLIPSTDPRSPSTSTTHVPFRAIHFMLLTLGLPHNNVLDYHNDKAKENSSSPLSFLTPLLDQTFNRLSVPGALPMTDLLPYTDIVLDIHTHALYSAKHSTATSRFPGIKPTPAASVSSTAPCMLQSSPVSLLPPDEDISEYIVDAKNVLADCLESFFPTPRTKSIRVCYTPTPCPFWIAARTSIRALRETPLKIPLTDGLERGPENAPIKDTNIFSHLDLDDESEYVLKKGPQDVTPVSTWNVLHLAVRSGRVDVLRYLLNVPQVPGPKGVDDGYIGSVQQLLKGRKVTVNKPSLCLCACYYNQSTALDVLRSCQYFLSKGPSDGVGRDAFLALSSSPKKRRAVSLTRAPVLHLSPAIEFKLSSKLHFEASNSDFSLLELSAYTGNEESFCYLLQSTDSKYTEEDILAVWATVTACIRRGCLSESCLLFAVTWVLEGVTKADKSASDALNDSVHLDDFDDVIEVLKKESILSLASTLAVVTAPPADTMRYPNRYRNRNSVTGKSTEQFAESGVSARNIGRDDEESIGPFQETVMHLACRRGLLLLVRVMLQYGANPHIRDSAGLTPWEAAVCAGHSDVTTLIGEYIPANGRVHGAVRTITQAMRSYVKNIGEY